MSDGPGTPVETEGDDVHGWMAAAEVAGLVALSAYVAVGVLGDGFLASASWPVRLAVLGFVAVELLIPVWVYLDVRRRPEMRERGSMWVHAAVMPVLNVFGLAAYLAERNRKAREQEPEDGEPRSPGPGR